MNQKIKEPKKEFDPNSMDRADKLKLSQYVDQSVQFKEQQKNLGKLAKDQATKAKEEFGIAEKDFAILVKNRMQKDQTDAGERIIELAEFEEELYDVHQQAKKSGIVEIPPSLDDEDYDDDLGE